MNKKIEKTYEIYYGLLVEFLDILEIKEVFVHNLLNARSGTQIKSYMSDDDGFSDESILGAYIKGVLLRDGCGIYDGLAAAFSFSKAQRGSDYWYALDKSWHRYLAEYKAGNVTIKSMMYKSIW